MLSKVCSRCELDKPVEEFHKQRISKDGLYPTCKECRKIKRPKRLSKPGYKRCTRCKLEKPLTLFIKTPKAKDGRGYYCGPCRSEYYKEYRANNLAERKTCQRRYSNSPWGQYLKRVSLLKASYGLSEGDAVDLMNSQRGCCKICKDSIEEYHIDHCHKTGRVRGLLCRFCNTGIGMLKDDVNILQQAIKYLNDGA